MNPKQVNSTNIKQFGFKIIADLEQRKFTFDINGLTTFNPGGDAAVQGICFEVIDPSGVTIHKIDFGSPDISPASQTNVEIDMPSGLSMFGIYRFRGQIKEANGTIYEVAIPEKRICQPEGFAKGVVPGNFSANVNCDIPNVIIKENTNFSYDKKAPKVISKDGRMYYPEGTIDSFPFGFTPFEITDVYTGTYTVRNKTLATYDIGDLVYVNVAYATNKEFKVQCGSKICDIACCIEDIQKLSEVNCDNAIGKAAREKLNSVAPILFVAIAKEKCGKDASAEIERVKEILGCSCDCDSEIVEGNPIGAGGSGSFAFEGECGTSVGVEQVGNTTNVKISTKLVSIAKSDVNDLAFTLSKLEADCNTIFKFAFNYPVLADTILDTIKGDDVLLAYLNSLIQSINLQTLFAGVDGKCVINTSNCNYTLSEDILTAKYITNVVIAGITYNAPALLLATNVGGINAWLGTLNKGVFVASLQAITGGQRLTIQSLNNPNAVGTSLFTILADATTVNRQWSRVCKSLEEILQAVIDYLCALDLANIKLGINTLKVCRILGNGNIQTTGYGSDVTLETYLQAISDAFCLLVAKVQAIAKPTCAEISAIYADSAEAMTEADVLHGTKNAKCAKVSIGELWAQLCAFIKSNPAARECFAQILCAGGTEDCPVVTDFTYILTEE